MSALKSVFSRQSSVISHLLLVISLLFIANLFFFTSPALAIDFKILNSDNFNDSINVQRFYRNQLVTLHTILLGTDPTGGPIYSEKLSSVTENGQTKIVAVPGLTTGSVNNGAIGMLGSTIVALYTPPTSSIEYLANLGENMGISPKTAHAQVGGSGESVIHPVLALWQVIRNIAYAGFILVFITAGLMIMFRRKLDPQTVIGIQQALPGLVIGLIMVTFSYFIAAFIVDLAFVGTKLVASIFLASGADNYYYDDNGHGVRNLDYTYNQSSALNMYGRAATRVQNIPDVLGGFWGIIGPKPQMQPIIPGAPGQNVDTSRNIVGGVATGAAGGAIVGSVVPVLGTALGAVVGGVVGGVLGFFSGPILADISQAAAGGIISLLSAMLIPIILMIALMIQFIRLIIALLMSYIQILIMVIAGPLFILISAVPGKGGVLSYWFKGLLANALVFPAVFAGFLFAGLLLSFTFDASKATMPLFGGLQPNIVGSLLAFGVLLGLPSIPDMVRKAMGVEGPQGFTQAAIGGFMGGVGGAKAGYGQAMEKTGLQGRKEAMEKGKMEEISRLHPAGATTRGERIISWLPGGRH